MGEEQDSLYLKVLDELRVVQQQNAENSGKLSILLDDRDSARDDRRAIYKSVEAMGKEVALTTARMTAIEAKHDSLANTVKTLADERFERIAQRKLLTRAATLITRGRLFVVGLLGSGGLLAWLHWPWPKGK